MLSSDRVRRWPKYLIDAVMSFLALHGAFNIGPRTEVAVTFRLFAALAGLTLVVAIIGHWLLKPKAPSAN